MEHDVTATLDLVRRAQDGDEQALAALFARYYERVRRIVRLRLGTRLRSVLESGDILQETFLSALKGFHRFEVRDDAAFVNWISRVAENQIRDAADHHRAQKRDAARAVPLEVGREDGGRDDPAATGPSPGEEAARGERLALVEECIAELPDEYRELIVLRDYVGESWEEVARQTGRPSPDAARMMHATALVELTRRVRARCGPDGRAR